jgi:transcriptional regulator of heat shock response
MTDNAIGRLGVIGPTRMDYDRVVPLVNFLAETLTHMLHEIEG